MRKAVWKVGLALAACAGLALAAIGLLARRTADAPQGGPAAPKADDAGADSAAVTNSVGMKMVRIPAGRFDMGTPSGQKGHEADETLHRVTISRAFRISATEVTQAQWEAVMGRRPGPRQAGSLPVERVSWNDAVAFCRKLSKTEGRTYRLPTEAEWEYACRAGSGAPFAGDDLDALAWYDDNSRGTPHPVATRRPNAWGLYDMHGNVAEWCADWYAPDYPAGAVTDPTGPAEGRARVVRGGSFASLARGCRSASRTSHPPNYQMKSLGFRVLMQTADQSPTHAIRPAARLACPRVLPLRAPLQHSPPRRSWAPLQGLAPTRDRIGLGPRGGYNTHGSGAAGAAGRDVPLCGWPFSAVHERERRSHRPSRPRRPASAVSPMLQSRSIIIDVGLLKGDNDG